MATMWRWVLLVALVGCGSEAMTEETSSVEAPSPVECAQVAPRGDDIAGDTECAQKERLSGCGEQVGPTYPSSMCVSFKPTSKEALRCVPVACNELGCCPGCMAGDLCVLEGRADEAARCVVGCCDDGDPSTLDAEDLFGGCIHD